MSQVGSFYQWYEVYKEEGCEPEQAENMAERSVRTNQPLPDWYINPEPKSISSQNCPDDFPF